jgi:hypothetical protein
MKDVQIGQVADSVLSVDFFYEEGEKGPFKPIARNIEMLRVSSKKSPYGVYMRAFPNSTIENVRVIDCKFENVEKGNVMQNAQNVTFNGTTINGKPVT